MTAINFNFESVNKVNAKRKLARKKGFSVNLKYQYICFPTAYVEDNKLEGKMIKWFVDVGKKAIGWKILGEETKELLCDLKEYVIVKKVNNQYRFSIHRVLHSLKFKDTEVSFKYLEVKDHVDMQNSFYGGIIHYLILDTPVHKELKK